MSKKKEEKVEEIASAEIAEEVPEEVSESETITLPRSKFKERLERARRQAVKSYGGLSPEDVLDLQKQLERFKKEQQKWQESELAYQARTEELETNLSCTEELRRRELIKSALTRLYLDRDGLPTALQDALNSMLSSDADFALGDDGSLSISRGEKELLTVEEFIERFLENRPYFRRAPGGRGSGIGAASTGFPPGAGKQFGDARLNSREGRLAAARKFVRE